jgi:uncharacterized metal-binding protein
VSSGKSHARASLILSAPVGLGAFIATRSIEFAAGATVGCSIVGQLISPDLDQISITRSESVAMRWLKIFGVAWVGIWLLYGWIIPHRSKLSHWPIIGTAGRLLYLTLPLLILGVELPVNAWVVGGVIGLGASDTAHWIMDKL